MVSQFAPVRLVVYLFLSITSKVKSSTTTLLHDATIKTNAWRYLKQNEAKRIKMSYEEERPTSSACPMSSRTFSQDSETIDFKLLNMSADSAGRLSEQSDQEQDITFMGSDEDIFNFDETIDFIYGRRHDEEQEQYERELAAKNVEQSGAATSVAQKRAGIVSMDPMLELMRSGSLETENFLKTITEPERLGSTVDLGALNLNESASSLERGSSNESGDEDGGDGLVEEFREPADLRHLPPSEFDYQYEPILEAPSYEKTGRFPPLSWRFSFSRRSKAGAAQRWAEKLKSKVPRQNPDGLVTEHRGESASSILAKLTRCLRIKVAEKHRPCNEATSSDSYDRRISYGSSISSSSSPDLSATLGSASTSTSVSSPPPPSSTLWGQTVTDTFGKPDESPIRNVSFVTLSDIESVSTSRSSNPNTSTSKRSFLNSPHTIRKFNPRHRHYRRHSSQPPLYATPLEKSIYHHQIPYGRMRPTPLPMVLEDQFDSTSELDTPKFDLSDGWDSAVSRDSTALGPGWPSQSLTSLLQSFH